MLACLGAGPGARAAESPESPGPSVTPTGEPAAPHLPGPPIGGPRMGETGVVLEPAPGLPGLPPDITAKSWLVADLDSGAVLAARDPHGRHRPASTLKTLTALALIPKVPAQSRVPFTAEALRGTEQADGVSSRVGLEVGRAYPARRLFEAMVALSANDAAEALAGALPGGRAESIALMNSEAQRLQAHDTVAGTPSGLDVDGQLTSAYDLALLARAALQLPDFREYTRAGTVGVISSKGVIGGSNHNRLLNSYPGAYSGKDGYTTKAGQVWWGAAEKGGRHLFVAVVDAGYGPVPQEIRLLDWGFAALPVARPVGALVDPVPPGGLPVPEQVEAPARARPDAAGDPGTSGAQDSTQVATALRQLRGGPSWAWMIAVAPVAALVVALRRRAVLARRPRRRQLPPDLSLVGSTPLVAAGSTSLATGAVKVVHPSSAGRPPL